MTEQEYLNTRLDSQIHWYSQKSQSAQRWFKRCKMAEILLSASIPMITLLFWPCLDSKYIVSAIGSILTILSACHGLYQWQEHWIEYRHTAETLKREKFLYLTRSGIYKTEDAFSILVYRCEQIIGKENTIWSFTHSQSERKA